MQLSSSGGGGGGRETVQRGPPNGAAGSGKPVSARAKQKIKEADAAIFSRLKLTGIEVLLLLNAVCYFVFRMDCVPARGGVARERPHSAVS